LKKFPEHYVEVIQAKVIQESLSRHFGSSEGTAQ
jgi:hypothetical protein